MTLNDLTAGLTILSSYAGEFSEPAITWNQGEDGRVVPNSVTMFIKVPVRRLEPRHLEMLSLLGFRAVEGSGYIAAPLFNEEKEVAGAVHK